MSYKIFLFCLLSLAAISNVLGQEQIVRDIVELKDGTIHKGEIIYHKIGQYIILRDTQDEVREYAESDIAEIRTEKAEVTEAVKKSKRKLGIATGRRKMPKGEVFTRGKSVFFQFGFGLNFNKGFSQNWWGSPSVNALIVNPNFSFKLGYRIKPSLNLALVYGIDGYRSNGGVLALEPLSVQVSGDIPVFEGFDAAVLPHYEVGVGYAFYKNRVNENTQVTGGPMLRAALGWRLRTRGKLDWLMNIGYKFQQTSQELTIFQNDPTGGPGTVSIIKGNIGYQKIYIELVMDLGLVRSK